MRILAAMSGGVDSAVAAARAVDEGHDVVGVHLALSRAGGTLRTGSRGCCTIEDAMDARRAADLLGIPFYVWDFSERFRDDVIDDFISEYRAGRTPNPCMRCNEKIKFAALLERALELGFDAVCTGHYATLVDGPDGRELHRASDEAKDQSYVLGVLTAEQLTHTYFPLGTTPSKAVVRAEAAERGLTVAQKPDSHDICFIPDGDTRGWLTEKVGAEQGQILDRDGAVVGRHEGAHAFTVGQRRGLQLGVPAPDGKPRFVLEVRPVTNTVVVGPKEALATAEISGERHSWAGRAPDTGAFACHAQIRAHAEPVPATATWQGGTVTVVPDEPFDGVAPGQTAVLYDGTRVVGQFTIARTVSAVPVGA
ncbi:tRNA 2-thiouridine(34) synthase MnmA [Microbacterium sp. EYE_5]|uniref:tRNA 2-thiouridine(34) synthase MnmA n=1 Tax=unclassified Microbacterium TaxID=2609290 RepID=UPI0020058170|nr:MULTISPECIES: tRNA 2-thiouridine(34) synthase MnmA [unclassified Microbacterium]MCK6080838.1 tRNA 2-thiouridine(34) synthase MnmA [Microbacterium sp. EYE_382]MCK6086109.1 tRNA 2-thiouridine(34) synthase MnmA [Microbacterium sp. EYE_384]MCK6124393.1 tRNA 2-thiouridine(34) synthase MnmA [Microbacterium sp. EYE_80]MCK6127302.1 tRNA 2-thiouridine(34) synthase MnmA [Microbacterium sp. EYE_79]MCK6141793.1 tRNA 2-thiouridine(34) synthase MnmA [Microbacterium sp. EYE_39]